MNIQNNPESSGTTNSFRDDLELARVLADHADAITVDRFQALDLRVSTKPDLTPVSDADMAVETTIRDLLAQQRPLDTIVGEEFGGDFQPEGRQWIIDPIDGTKNFVRGVPIWATLIALLNDGIPVVGFISAPALGQRWWASENNGSFHQNLLGKDSSDKAQKIQVSTVDSLSEASIAISSLSGWGARRENLLTLTDQAWRTRGYGDFYIYCLLAQGAVDVSAEPSVNLWDLAPLDILVREAGGKFTDIAGNPGPYGGSAIASNARLHQTVLTQLNSSLSAVN